MTDDADDSATRPSGPRLRTPRQLLFSEGSTAFNHGVIGVEYLPDAKLPSANPLRVAGRLVSGVRNEGPLVRLLIDDAKLHEWLAPLYDPPLSRVTERGWATPDFHTRPLNDLYKAIEREYNAIPASHYKEITTLFQPGVDASFVENDAVAIAQEARGISSIKPIHRSCSVIALRLEDPIRLMGMLKHLTFDGPKVSEPLIDDADLRLAASRFAATAEDRIASSAAATGRATGNR